ncbi:MAG: c-type cytochrome [Gallionella sp.]
MKIANYIAVLMMLGMGGAQAAESVADKPAEPVAKHGKVHVHKKCMEKNGKPCHLHKDAASAVPAVDSAASAVAVVPAAAPVVAVPPVAKKPEVIKAGATLSDADGRKLATKSGCFTCHAVERKVLGPAWREVATKYRNDASAEAMLIAKVSKGGKGTWGSTPMPANSPRVSDADIKALVKFVLAL